jgi:phage portal protein BeeE
MYQSGGARGAIVSDTGATNANLNPEQLKSIDDAIGNKVNGKHNKGQVARIPGFWKYLEMGMSAVDMQMVDAGDKVFIKICNLYGVNPQIFMTATTFNNVEQARADLITNLVLPMCCSLRDEENKMFLPAFGLDVTPSGKVQTRFTTDVDVSTLSELQDDNEKLAQSLVSAYWLTINERRCMMGQEELTDPQADMLLVPNTLVTLEDAVMPPETLQTTPYGNSGNSRTGLAPGNAGNPGKGQVLHS